MGIPKKALKESQLRYLTAGSAVKDGSHQIFRVTFIESGTEKAAFFKKIDPSHHYPELLALISVAVSAFKRLFQGKNSAEERLVFDNSDKLIGTLSIAVEGFKPLNFADEEVPTDLGAKEAVIPSTKTLIEKNMMEILLGRYFLDDDDAHPHNLGFAGDAADIDFDMFLYWFTIWMKEPRPVIGVPKKRVSLTVKDWESFPITKDAKPYHWPTYTYPGQETLPTVMPVQGTILPRVLPKAYADPIQFQLLANSAEAQEQKLAAVLKILLTYQPAVIRARLVELFDNMPLNYTSLGSVLSVKYETEFPSLCNEHTNVKPFIDFIMTLYQEHYDNLYRVVVFYMGCENNGYGVPLPAMSTALYNKPSFYQKIVAWIKIQNTTLYSKEAADVKYNLDQLQQRYHQVWRDAFAPSLKVLLHDSFNLTNKLLDIASTREMEFSFLEIHSPTEGKKATDDTLTRAWELFGTIPELSKEKLAPLIAVDKESKLRTGLLLLVDFTNEFYAIAKNYYEKECADLTEGDNLTFVESITALYSKYNLPIRQNLANTSTYANEFNTIARNLMQFAEQANFQLHLTTTDEQMKDSFAGLPTKELLSHTDPEVMAQFNDSLFVWAKTIKAEELTRLINDIIDTHYAPVVASISRRVRTVPVKAYLEASKEESGDNRLAYILGSGNPVGALNMALIQQLTPHVLLTHHLPSISKAIKSGAFITDIGVFTRASVHFANTDSRFMHVHHKDGIVLFYQTLFEWVDSLPSTQFKAIVNSALTEYEAQLWLSSSRRVEIEGYCRKSGQAKALAMTFINGKDTSSLNDILFHKIVSAIQDDLKRNRERQAQQGYKLIGQYCPEQHKKLYMDEIRVCSAAASHRQERIVTSESTVSFM